MHIEFSKKLRNTPPYLFVEIERKYEEAVRNGIDIINMAIGDPDIPTPSFIIEKFNKFVWKPEFHRYPHYDGCFEFREEVSGYIKNRFNVDVSPEDEVVALLGAKEGIAHIFLAFVDEGDFALVPDPSYPVYNTAALFAGGIPYPMPLLPENGYLPCFEDIPGEVVRRSRIMFINYPNNPTGAVATGEFYRKAVEFCLENDIILCNDNAYCDFIYDNDKIHSVLNIDGARECAIEFYTCSKSYNMTGWRIGYAVGNARIISGLKAVKHNLDSGQFTAIQYACMEAFKNGDPFVSEMRKNYLNRINIAVKRLKAAGLNANKPQGTFYLWVPVPEGWDSIGFSDYLLEEARVLTAPGLGFGRYGEGFIRFSLTLPGERLEEAMDRIEDAMRYIPQRRGILQRSCRY